MGNEENVQRKLHGFALKDVCGEDNNLLYLGVCGTTKIC